MSPQIVHALRQAGIMVLFIAVTAALGGIATEVVPLIPEPWGVMIGAMMGPLIRWIEGVRDAHRAEIGEVKARDVAYYAGPAGPPVPPRPRGTA